MFWIMTVALWQLEFQLELIQSKWNALFFNID